MSCKECVEQSGVSSPCNENICVLECNQRHHKNSNNKLAQENNKSNILNDYLYSHHLLFFNIKPFVNYKL